MTSMDVNTMGGGANGPVKGGAPVNEITEGLATSATGAVEIWAVRLHIGRRAMPGLASRELLWAWWACLTLA